MDYNQIQEKEMQEKSQPLPDSNDEIRIKKRNEKSAISSFVLGCVAIIMDPFIIFFASFLGWFIIYVLTLPLQIRDNQIFNAICNITFGGINIISCILNVVVTFIGIGLVWRGIRSQYWYFALVGLLFNLFAVAVMIVFLYLGWTEHWF